MSDPERSHEQYDPTSRWIDLFFLKEPPDEVIMETAQRIAEHLFDGVPPLGVDDIVHEGTTVMVLVSISGDRNLNPDDPDDETGILKLIEAHLTYAESPHATWLVKPIDLEAFR